MPAALAAEARHLALLRRELDRIAARKPGKVRLREYVSNLLSGDELRTDPFEYRWHGLKRGGDPAHPWALFQYTIEGMGVFRDAKGGLQKLTAGRAFTAIIPSDHEYYLPAGSEGWRFVWLLIRHPYAVPRIRDRLLTSGAVWDVPPDSLLAGTTLRLHEAIFSGALASRYDEEQRILDFMIAFDRFGDELEHPAQERESMLKTVRDLVEEDLKRPMTIEAIAARFGMSRTHFSHLFRKVTGLSPAQYILQVRLGRVAELLGSTLKLESIASETGFANATHLCRVFRQYYHLSPDTYRRQRAGGRPRLP